MAWDVLGLALSVIPAVPVVYRKRLGSTENEMGIIVPQYAAGVTIAKAHVQGIRNSTVEQLGLQTGRNYRLVHLAADALTVAGKPEGGDKVEFYGLSWVIVHVSPHYAEDGWNKLVVCEEKDYHDAITSAGSISTGNNTNANTNDAIPY